MLTISLIILIFSNSINTYREKSILYSRAAITILLFCFLIGYNNLHYSFLTKGIGIFSGLFYSNCTTNLFQIFILLIASIILLLTSFYPRKIMLYVEDPYRQNTFSLTKLTGSDTVILNKESEQFRILEYPLVILFIILGGTLLMSSSDLVSIFLSIELQSYGLYLLCTIYRDSESATSGGIMYFLLGGLSSCFILLGTALLYANSGTTSLDNLYIITAISNVDQSNLQAISFWYKPYYINVSLLFMSVGFLFKVSAAPFHFWSPDVYDAIPTVVTTFVSIVAKISIFVFLLGLVHNTGKLLPGTDFSWKTSLLLSCFLSLVIGTVLGLTQSRIKRLFAFSTISHVGFMLLGLTVHTIESTQAFIFYLIQYSVSNLNAFIIVIAIGYFLYGYVDKLDETKSGETKSDETKSDEKSTKPDLIDANNSPIQFIDQLKGFYFINPVLSLSLGITLFSFAGIPPLIGFFGKLMVLNAALDNGYVFMCLVAILTSVVSAVYYLIVINKMFFHNPDYTISKDWQPIPISNFVEFNEKEPSLSNTTRSINIKNIFLSNYLSICISIVTLLIVLFIVNPHYFLNIVCILSLTIYT